ncbi:MAG: RNase adapter RapZ [Bradymonadia bacterium]
MSESTSPLQLYVVTGLSGSGISTAIHALEDLGFFCVDNLPPPLIPDVIRLAAENGQTNHLVLGIDARAVHAPEEIHNLLTLLNQTTEELGVDQHIFFLEASPSALQKRYSVSRRPHPLGADTPLIDAINAERVMMHPFREVAHQVLDTTALNVHDCKRAVQGFVGGGHDRLAVSVISFGFRHGVPHEADIVWDVRFLPNPHFNPELRPLSGRDAGVRDYVLAQPATQRFLGGFLPLLDESLPYYQSEGKSYLTVAIGCTGGRHRSVALAEHIGAHLSDHGTQAQVRHRDIDKGGEKVRS